MTAAPPSELGAFHVRATALFVGAGVNARGAVGTLGPIGKVLATKLQLSFTAPLRAFHPSIAMEYSVPATTLPSTLLQSTPSFGASSFIPITVRAFTALPEYTPSKVSKLLP